jgi:hypothetical protein
MVKEFRTRFYSYGKLLNTVALAIAEEVRRLNRGQKAMSCNPIRKIALKTSSLIDRMQRLAVWEDSMKRSFSPLQREKQLGPLVGHEV